MNTTRSTIATFAASILFGCGAAIAIASTAAISQSAPSLRQTVQAAPLEVIRLAPVAVTISKARFEEIRAQDTALARSNDGKKVTRG